MSYSIFSEQLKTYKVIFPYGSYFYDANKVAIDDSGTLLLLRRVDERDVLVLAASRDRWMSIEPKA